MSLGFELAQGGSANQYANALGDTKPVDQVTPGAFEGFGKAVGMGLMKGGATAARALSMAGGAAVALQDKITGGTERSDIYFERHDRIFNRATEYWTPRPDEVGAAGRIVGGLAEMALPLMAGGGNPALMMGGVGLGTSEDLVRQGVDATTARAVGTVQAAALGVGFKLPFLGRNLMERVAFGAASNAAVGMAAAGASAGQLTKDGYAKQAEQFDPLDVEARAVDVLMGAVFGGIAHVVTPKGRSSTRITQDTPLAAALDALPDSQRDALLTANNVRHADVETAPGRPRTMDAQNDHTDAIARAMDELDAGERVTAQVSREAFDVNPTQDAFRNSITQAADEVRGRALPVEAREATATDVEVQNIIDSAPQADAPADITPSQPADAVPTGPDAAQDAGQPRQAEAPEITAAVEAVARNPDMPVPLDDGTVVRAADALAKADEVIAQAQTESKAFDAAISCMLRG